MSWLLETLREFFVEELPTFLKDVAEFVWIWIVSMQLGHESVHSSLFSTQSPMSIGWAAQPQGSSVSKAT